MLLCMGDKLQQALTTSVAVLHANANILQAGWQQLRQAAPQLENPSAADLPAQADCCTP